MRSWPFVLASLLAGISLSQAQVRDLAFPNALSRPYGRIPDVAPRVHALASTANVARTAFSPNVILLANCPPGAAACGYVPVPLDRKHPHGSQIKIYFEQILI